MWLALKAAQPVPALIGWSAGKKMLAVGLPSVVGHSARALPPEAGVKGIVASASRVTGGEPSLTAVCGGVLAG